MKNDKVAEHFANGARSGRSLNMFVDGDTIFSYGYHFPICKRLSDGSFFFTVRTYSHTTAKHISHVRNAISGARVIYGLFDSNNNIDIESSIDYMQKELLNAKNKHTRARLEHTKSFWLSEQLRLRENVQRLVLLSKEILNA